MPKCKHCSKEYKTRSNHYFNHVKKCGYSANKEYIDEFQKQITYIRENTLSVYSFFENVAGLLGKYGIHINFYVMPESLNLRVSNANSSPILGVENWAFDSDKPTSYIGFTGRLCGEFKANTNNKLNIQTEYCNVFDIFGKGSLIPFVHLSNGGCGKKFNIGCNLWLDDFPKMKETFEINGNFKDSYCENYTEVIKTIGKKYDLEKNSFVDNSKIIVELNEMTRSLATLTDRVEKMSANANAALNREFENTYNVDIPRPSRVFHSNDIMEIINKLSAGGQPLEMPCIESLKNELLELTTTINELIDNNPEYYI